MDRAVALTAQGQELEELARDADWSVPVPTCPGWTLLQLLRHVGRGDRWAAQIITDRADTSLDPRSVRDGKPPADAPDAIRWLSQGPLILLAAVQDAGPGTEVATFTGPKPAAWPASADLAVSGPATGLLLALLRRQPAEDTGISMQGDTALWRSWLAGTPL